MGFWSNLGSSIVTSGGDIATNTIGGLINAGINKALGDYERQQNYKYNEKAAANADRRARAQFRDMYSYGAQIQEMKKAGLNPALMYGGASGQGGATAPQGMGAGGVQKGLSNMDLMSLAEIEVMKSQANLNNAEAENVSTDTTKKEQEITNLVTENGYKQVATRLVVAQADLAECNADLAWNTYMANLQNAFSAAENAANIARSSGIRADIDESTFEAAYQQAWAELDKTLSDSALNRAEINLTKAQIKDIGNQIWKRQWDVTNEERNQNREDLRLSYDKQYMEEEISKWLREQNQWVEEMKIKGYEIKVDFWSEILGYLFNLGGIALTNAAKPKIIIENKTTQEGKRIVREDKTTQYN